MAKVTNSIALKGIIDLENDTITEITKEAENEYSLSGILKRFDGRMSTLSIKEDTELEVVSEIDELEY